MAIGRLTLNVLAGTFIGAAFGVASTSASAQSATTDTVVRVVDIGAGLCVVIAVPGGHAMLYDAGPPDAARCVDAARELVPGGRFDLVVLSHSDNDHVAMIPAILGDNAEHPFRAAVIIHPGDDHTRDASRSGPPVTQAV